MMTSQRISEVLFPNRNLDQEWKISRPTKSIPPILRLNLHFNLEELKTIASQCSQRRDFYFQDHLAEAFSKQISSSRPLQYCDGLLMRPSDAAYEIQKKLNDDRNKDWLEHHRELSHLQIVRSLRYLDDNYNPLIDERNYHCLNPELKGSEVDRLRQMFRAPCVRMRFTQLRPGQEVAPHIDSSARYAMRIIIPVHTNKDSVYGARSLGRNEEWVLEEGNAYLVNGGYVHWARNHGSCNRVILIFSLDGQQDLDWIEKAGPGAGAGSH